MTKYYTSEHLKNKFENRFDLVNYAIKVADKSISESQPITLQEVLDKVEKLPNDHLTYIPEVA
jgi:hypothetical protein